MRLDRQKGIVLVMSLILLIVISLVAVIAVRAAISGEQVSKAVRTHTAAFQSAETALRYCEDQILKSGAVTSGKQTLKPIDAPLDNSAPKQWLDRASWSDPAKAVSLSADTVNSSDPAARKASMLPRCMVEAQWLPSDDGRRRSFVITAVGFSPDFRLGAFKTAESGGEVWLQSTVTPKP